MATIERSRIFTQELFDEICRRIANGKSLRKICMSSTMPSIETVREWLRDNDKLAVQYARAREEQADYYVDRIMEISDNVKPVRDSVEKAKLQTDNLKWIAAKQRPKKYGDKLDLTSNGKDLPTPIFGGVSTQTAVPPPKDPVDGQ